MTLAACILAAATFTRAMEQVKSMDPLQAQSVYDCAAVRPLHDYSRDLYMISHVIRV